MKIGVTGTREGMNEQQFQDIVAYLSQFNPAETELHHGDCNGVDAEVAELATQLGFRVVCHPPESDYLRAFHKSHEFRKPLGYLKRDRNIVDETDLLIVVPLQDRWQPKGGTWYTHDYAKKKNKNLVVFFPKRQ